MLYFVLHKNETFFMLFICFVNKIFKTTKKKHAPHTNKPTKNPQINPTNFTKITHTHPHIPLSGIQKKKKLFTHTTKQQKLWFFKTKNYKTKWILNWIYIKIITTSQSFTHFPWFVE